MKLSLNGKYGIIWALILLGSGLVVLGGTVRVTPLYVAGAVVLLAGIVLLLKWWRCPYCGRPLKQGRPPRCEQCGGRIDYKAK